MSNPADSSAENHPRFAHRAIVGNGRMGRALAKALPVWSGPFGRGCDGEGFDVVLLAVPDAEISAAAGCILPGRLVGHCSGATGLDALTPHESFSIHPLMSVPREGASFAGAGAAVAGSTDRAQRFAEGLALNLGMQPVTIADADRAAYHAAASIASNFLVTLEDFAETLLCSTGAERSILVPLVRAAVENWATLGGERALTGPIARGDHATVARQRQAVSERSPQFLPLFDELCTATRALANRESDDDRGVG